MAKNLERETGDACDSSYLIVRPESGGLVDLFHFWVSGSEGNKFIETTSVDQVEEGKDHRWVIVVSIIVRKIIAMFGKPMEWYGVVIEFLLNLLSLNGGIHGLFLNLLSGKLVMPERGSDTYISAIGHLDPRVDLYKGYCSLNLDVLGNEISDSPHVGNRALMDLCILASKIAYENAEVVKKVVAHHWKMHFVKFYNCWNDYQKERSTQVFILCDKPKDANLVLISFRGTEPFDADDWITDFDYSWYEIPNIGKVHMGFLEALGLGNRNQASTFLAHLQAGGQANKTTSVDYQQCNSSTSDSSASEDKLSAYYAVSNRLKDLLTEHKKAKFIVTGHSLGGAVAILFPVVLLLHKEEELMKRLLGVYTFGQPRIGDRKLHKFMEAHLCHPVPKYFRVVYCNDLVPRLPYDNKTFLYKHFGLCLYYNSFYVEQNMDEEPNRNYFGLRFLFGEYLNAVWELIRSLTMSYTYGPEYRETWFSIFLRVFGLVMPGMSAHNPRDYVNCVRLGRGKLQMGFI